MNEHFKKKMLRKKKLVMLNQIDTHTHTRTHIKTYTMEKTKKTQNTGNAAQYDGQQTLNKGNIQTNCFIFETYL